MVVVRDSIAEYWHSCRRMNVSSESAKKMRVEEGNETKESEMREQPLVGHKEEI